MSAQIVPEVELAEHIPAELRARPQWVDWKSIPQPDNPKPKKLPINPKTGKAASVTNPETWADFDTAVAAARHYRFCKSAALPGGLGFVFTEADPFAGIDLDHCRNPMTGEIAPCAQGIIDRLRSYTEVSPSGTGVKIFLRARLPENAKHDAEYGTGSVEMYDSGRYFTVTGQHVSGTPVTVEDRQDELNALYDNVFGKAESALAPIDDEQVKPPSRHKLLLMHASHLHKKGLSEEEILACLKADNDLLKDPKPDSELHDIAKWFAAKSRSPAKSMPAASTATETTADSPQPNPAGRRLPSDEAAARTASLLETCQAWIVRYVIVSMAQAVILAVWVLHTYVMDACDWTPYLHIRGPDKACGKTLLMDVLAPLAFRARTASGASPAALVRIVDKLLPTLFLDEMDAATNGNKEMAEAIRGILDAGFKRGGVFYKCDGKDNEVREFKVFGPKVFAGIGDLPDTIASRSIPIEMHRKLRSERIERFRGRAITQLAGPIQAELEQWGLGVVDQLKAIEPTPIEALSDRTNDVAEILLAIAQLAGGDWLQRLTTALLTVYGAMARGDKSIGEVLLSDLRDIFEDRGTAHIPSKELASALCEIEGRPWAEWSHGRGLSPNNLARQLAKYQIMPVTIRMGDETAKGYRRADFTEVWDRYCGLGGSSTVTTSQPASLLAETPFSNRNAENNVTFQKCPETRMDIGVCRCDDSKPDIPAQGSSSNGPADGEGGAQLEKDATAEARELPLVSTGRRALKG